MVADVLVKLQNNGIPGLQDKFAFLLKADSLQNDAGILSDAVEEVIDQVCFSDAVVTQDKNRRGSPQQKRPVRFHQILHFLLAADHVHRGLFLLFGAGFDPRAEQFAMQLGQLGAWGDAQLGIQQLADVLIHLDPLVIKAVFLVAFHHQLIDAFIQGIIFYVFGKQRFRFGNVFSRCLNHSVVQLMQIVFPEFGSLHVQPVFKRIRIF